MKYYETEAQKRMMDRRRKLAKIKEMFFNPTVTEDELDVEEVEHIPEEDVSSVKLNLVKETIDILPQAQKRMMERRRKLAKTRERFFNQTLTEDPHDVEEVEHLPNEVMSSILLDLVRESVLLHREEIRQDESKEDDKYEQKAQPIEVSKEILPETTDILPQSPADILPKLSGTGATRSMFNESKRRFRGLLKRLLPCVH